MSPFKYPFVTPHALERFQVHRKNAGVPLFLANFEDATAITPVEAHWVLLRPFAPVPNNAYFLSADRRGMFVIGTENPDFPVFTTYIRLNPIPEERAVSLHEPDYSVRLGKTYRGKLDRVVVPERVSDGRVYFRDAADGALRSLSESAFCAAFWRAVVVAPCS